MMRVGPCLAVCVFLLATACAEPAANGGDEEPEPIVRRAVYAGSWYPGTAEALRAEVTRHLDAAPAPELPSPVRALVSPHAGYRYSGPMAGRTYATIRGRPIERVVVLAPSHHVGFRKISVPRVTHYETPLGRIPLDLAVRDRLLATPGFTSNARAHRREHSLEVQLPFLQVALGSFTLVPLVVGQPPRERHADLADAIRPLLDEKTLLVVSTDFTHYGMNYDYVPFAIDIEKNLAKLDGRVADAVLDRNVTRLWRVLDETKATVCGRHPLALMLHLLGRTTPGHRLGYETSGARTGSFENSVSYVALAFTSKKPLASLRPPGLSGAERATLLRLARRTLEEEFASGRRPDPAAFTITPPLREKRGVFVTLHQGGRLRGCIGYIVGRKPLAEAVIDNALNAGFRDPRFPPITAKDLPTLHIEISVMTPLRRISDPLTGIEVGRHGIVLEKHGRRGVFLPQVPMEQGWDLEEYLHGICRKAGLRDPEAWREGATIQTFEAQVFGEPKVGKGKGERD